MQYQLRHVISRPALLTPGSVSAATAHTRRQPTEAQSSHRNALTHALVHTLGDSPSSASSIEAQSILHCIKCIFWYNIFILVFMPCINVIFLYLCHVFISSYKDNTHLALLGDRGWTEAHIVLYHILYYIISLCKL